MNSGHHFQRLTPPRRPDRTAERPSWRGLRALLLRRVMAGFVRLGGARPVAIPLLLADYEAGEDPPVNPGHPACRKHANTSYCRESWQLHLAELCLRPQTHWHTCDYRKRCALVPLMCCGRCVAAVKLACPVSVPAAAFERKVELLDLLVREFVSSEADFLARWPCRALPASDFSRLAAGSSPERLVPLHSSHPQILRALRYMDEHLAEPALTVSVVAQHMDVHPNYLSHLFVDQVGQRMSRFIMGRRIELARTLLASTTWQVKRIARDTGHANPRWFTHVFTELTGLTPSAYRKKSHHAG